MNVARKNPRSCFYNGKIYVVGGLGCSEQRSPFAEVFDTRTQSWKCLRDPGAEVRRHLFAGIVEIEGKIYLRHGSTLYANYDPKQCTWESQSATFASSECVMDNVSYSIKYQSGGWYNLVWRDMNGGDSKEVKWLESFENKYKRHGGSYYTTSKLATCGRKLYIMWEEYRKKSIIPNNTVKICCAEISIEKRNEYEIWGNVEWLDVVHIASTLCNPLHCLAISV